MGDPEAYFRCESGPDTAPVANLRVMHEEVEASLVGAEVEDLAGAAGDEDTAALAEDVESGLRHPT